MIVIDANGANIPAIGLGTWTLKGEACVDMVARAIDAGYRHLDTAAMYENEEAVGEGVRRSGFDRAQLFVTTKVWWTDIGADKLVESARRSVDKLGIGAVDLLLIHWPNPAVPLEDSIAALNRAADEGLARHVGVANFTAAMVDEAAHLSSRKLACNQVEYHPLLSQDAVIGAGRRHGMATIAYSPVGQGGEVLSSEPVTAAARAHNKTPAQVVLRWEVQQDGVGAIPRTSKPERLAENLGIFDFELSAEEHAAISAMTSRRKRLVDPSFAPVWDRV
jgi:diketogulonate reductase-like aldo/keto reductase